MAGQNLTRRTIRARTRARWAVYGVADRLRRPPAQLECPICAHQDLAASFTQHLTDCIFGGGRLVRHECPSCGVIFGSARMLALSPAELEREYAELYATYDEGDTTDSELAAFFCLRPSRHGRYLNFGCGRWSRAIEVARALGYQVLGYDPHVRGDAAEWLLTRPEQLAGLHFDGILTHNVLEHLPRPIETLRWLRGLLAAGGAMAHATPCYRYCYEYSRFHLFFFTGTSPERLASAAGLVITETPHDHVRLFRPVGAMPLAYAVPDFSASYRVETPPDWQPGEVQRYPVRVTNTGGQLWLPEGPTAVHLGAKVVEPGAALLEPVARHRLPHAVPPGASAVVDVDVAAPERCGHAQVVHALVWEQRAWFDEAERSAIEVGAVPVIG